MTTTSRSAAEGGFGLLCPLRAALFAGTMLVGMAASAVADPAADAARIEQLLQAEQPADAEAAARFALEQADAGPAATANLHRLLGDALFAQKRYAEAEPLYLQALAEAADAGIDDRDTLGVWRRSLGHLMQQTGRFVEAERWYREALTDHEAAWGPEHARMIASVEGLALALEGQRRYGDAAPLMQRAFDIRARTEGDGAALAIVAMRLGINYRRIDRTAEAETAFRRALAIREAVFGPESERVADAARMLATTLSALGREAEAEIHHRRALEISDKTYGHDHILTAFDMVFLGILYTGQRRFAEAEPLLARALAIMETNPEAMVRASAPRLALVNMLESQGRTDEAAERAERGLADAVALKGNLSEEAATFSSVLASLRSAQGRHGEAERLAREHLAIVEGIDAGPLSVLSARQALASVLKDAGHAQVALEMHIAVLAELQARYGEEAPAVRRALDAVGRTHFALGDYAAAAHHLERVVAWAMREADRNIEFAFKGGVGAIEDRAIASGGSTSDLVRAWYRMADDDPGLAERAFLAAQRIIDSQAAAALSQTGMRQAAGGGALAALVRERQDLADAWRKEDRRRTDLLALPLERRDPQVARAIAAALADIDARLDAVDARLAEEFPEFAALQKPSPVDFATVQARLADDEVLLFYADMSRRGDERHETFVWVVPKEGPVRWRLLTPDSRALSADVRKLRDLMGVGPVTRGAASLAARAGSDTTGDVLDIAHDLYGSVLAPVADLIEGKRLVVVPSDRLSGLPFQLLVSEAPPAEGDRYRDARWLARDHALTVLPSVAALGSATVGTNVPDGDREPYLGFANPLLTGASGADRRAFAREGCTPAAPADVLTASADLPAIDTLFRGATADVEAVRLLAPLPETVDEACAIAAALGADADAVRQGADATETEIRRLSDDGSLARASIIHFATHGLVSGELSGLAEPAIVLTPPAEAGRDDDGLLTASEVATLRLDADWVILSACNTAAGESGGEALSGLARAFFYAGARALMVSHWPVNSDAAVRLATGAIDELARDPRLDRAEALRRAMVAEIERGGRYAEPTNWAPFIVVGASR